MTAIDLTNSNTATVDGRTYTYNSTTNRWDITTGNSAGLTTEQVQDAIAAQLVTNGSHTGISFAYDDSGDGAIDATIGTLNQNTTGTAATLTTPRSIGGPSFDGSADINLPGVNTTGNQNTSGTAATLTTPREINGVAFNGSADITIPGGDPTIYATMALLVAATGMSAGDMAFVTANNNLYLYTGSGWFKVATVENNSPTAITGVAAATALASDGTATVITAVSTDPEGFPLTWSYSVTTGSLTNGGGATATVSQADNVFTITPTTTEAYAGTFSITFSATDGTNAVTAISAFTLTFGYLQQAILHASDAQTNDWFGSGAAIDGDTLIVGASAEDAGGTNAGAVYVFTRSGTTWSQQAKLTASDSDSNHFFGSKCAISGDTIIVGVQNHDGDSSTQLNGGAVYIFTRSGTTWSQQAKFHNNGNGTGDRFGNSVDIDGDTAIIGAWRHSGPFNSSDHGSAYVFTRSGTTWSQSKYLTASDAENDNYFGKTVRISGGTIAIYAQMANNTDTSAGAVYVFTGSGSNWTQQQKLVASDADDWDYFGLGLGIDGDTIIAGAYAEDTGGSDAGAAYVFTRSGTTWSQQYRIVASDIQAGDKFGLKVDISGDVAIVAAQEEDTGGSNAGAAYIFTRSGTTWSQQQKLVAPSAAADDYFGNSVAIDTDTVVVGAYKKDIGVTNAFPQGVTDAGAAYVFVS